MPHVLSGKMKVTAAPGVASGKRATRSKAVPEVRSHAVQTLSPRGGSVFLCVSPAARPIPATLTFLSLDQHSLLLTTAASGRNIGFRGCSAYETPLRRDIAARCVVGSARDHFHRLCQLHRLFHVGRASKRALRIR